MKTRKFIFTVFLIIFFGEIIIAQNVGISETAITPDASSILEVKSTNKGILIPRVSLTGTSDNTSISSAANSLFIYNIATAGTIPSNVYPGYYYWSSSNSKWLRLCSDNDAWLLSGNNGTNPTTDFIGTTDAQSLLFKTNNIERMRIESSGNVAIGEGSSWGKLTVNNGRFVVQNLDGYVGSGSTFYKDNPWIYLWSRETNLSSSQGANIIFAAMQNSTDAADLCMIEGLRENAITNNTASRLIFSTRPANDNMMRRLTIDSNGDFTFKPDNESDKSIVFNDSGMGTNSEPTIVPSTNNFGFIGTSTVQWWSIYSKNIYADNVNVSSSKQWKANITPLNSQKRFELYEEFKKLDVVSYNFINNKMDSIGNIVGDKHLPETFGLIVENSPEIIVSDNGNGIKLYEYISLLTVALQESNKRIDELEAKIAELEK